MYDAEYEQSAYGEGEGEEEMPDTERELAEDAAWKKIQQNTFTRWANEHLKHASKHIDDLATDLSDGLKLISLIEVLSQKRMPKHNKRPNFRSQKLENVSVALKFLEDQGIRIVNIDSTDIVNGKLKLILGLIWTLILHYSISMPMWEDDEAPWGGEQVKPDQTPKQKLLGWIQNKVPNYPISNFTTDWNDGKAIGALVDGVAPGLCPEWTDWDPKNATQNAGEAMQLADDWLGIPQLVEPQEMTNPKVDELSMMTYLSQFPHGKLKPGAPLRLKTDPSKVKAYGPGIQPKGNHMGAPAKFTVETFAAGQGKVSVTVTNPSGQQETVEIVDNKDAKATYTVTYTPKMEGNYVVKVTFNGVEIPKSPFKVEIKGEAGDPTKCTAEGPGLQPLGNIINKPTWFKVNTQGAGRGKVDCIILDPKGQKHTTPVKVTDQGDGTFLCEYKGGQIGLHSVNVFFAGKPIKGSPFGVKIEPVGDPKKVKAVGRGLQKKGVRQRDIAEFKVFTKGAGEGVLKVRVLGPGGVEEDCRIIDNGDGTFSCSYSPMMVGRYIIQITWGGQDINKSPFEVNVGKVTTSKVRAYGPGLEGGMVGHSADFTVETNGETGPLGFAIEGPSQARIECHDNGDGSADVKYWPTAPGDYFVHVLCNEEDILNSPFHAQILPKDDSVHPENVKVFGPGLEKSGIMINIPMEFTVDTRTAGKAPLQVSMLDVDYNPVDVQVTDNKDGTYTCRYTATRGVKHTINVTYSKVNVPNAPFRVYLTEPSNPDKVKVYGPGVEKGVTTNQPTTFTVDCTEAGPGDVQIALTNDKGQDVPIDIEDNKDGTFTIRYNAKMVGKHTITVLFAGKEIPTSPYKVNVLPSFDVNRIRVEGLDTPAVVNKPKRFKVITKEVITTTVMKETRTVIKVKTPSGRKLTGTATPSADGAGFDCVFLPDEVGEHTVMVEVNNLKLKQPFKVASLPTEPVLEPTQAAPGQEKAPQEQQPLVGTLQQPMQAAPGAKPQKAAPGAQPGAPGQQPVQAAPGAQPVQAAPGQKPVQAAPGAQPVQAAPGTQPTQAAPGAQPVPGAPGAKPVTEAPLQPQKVAPVATAPGGAPGAPGAPDPSKVKVYGPGLTGGPANTPCEFTIDTRGAGPGALGVTVEGPSEAKLVTKDNGDGTCGITYMPTQVGEYAINVTFADKPVNGSPFKANVTPGPGAPGAPGAPVAPAAPGGPVDVSSVKVTGTGVQPQGVFLDSPTEFTVDASRLSPKGEGNVRATLQNPQGAKADCPVKNKHDGTYVAQYTPFQPGPHKVDVTYENVPVPGSPFNVNVTPGNDPARCRAFGPGLDSGYTGQNAQFTVETKGAGAGGLGLAIEGPSEAKMTCKDNRDGSCSVEYLPTEPGDYDISIKFAEQHIPGSPFHVRVLDVVDVNKVQTYGPGLEPKNCRAGVPVSFKVDTTRAGQAPLDVAVKSDKGPCAQPQIDDNGDGTYDVTYMVPNTEGANVEVGLNYDGQKVPGSPHKMKVLPTCEPNKVRVTGPGVGTQPIYASYPVDFTVDTRDAGFADLEVTILNPDGQPCKAAIADNGDGTYRVEYLAEDVGRYTVSVKYGGRDVPGVPFTTNVIPCGDANKVKLQHGVPEMVTVDEEYTITLDTANAGNGNITCRIRSNTGKGDCDIDIQDNGDGTMSIFYRLKEQDTYQINIKFGGQPVPEGDFTITATQEEVITQETHRAVRSAPSDKYRPIALESIPVGETGTGTITGEITMPSGKKAVPQIQDNKNGTITVKYHPSEAGLHELMIKYNGYPVQGSPFQFHVDAISCGNVTAYGPGLSHGVAEQPANFTIVTKDAGAGGLSLAVEGPSKAEITCHDNKNGTCDVSYMPTAPGDYHISVKFAGKDIVGSPFTAKITGEGRKRAQMMVGSASEVSLKVEETDLRSLTATIRSPSGIEEPCFLKRLQNGHLGISFTPHEVGEHLVSVKRNGQHIANSPFKVMVGEKEIGDANKVKVHGPGLKHAKTHELNEFTVDTKDAGYGGLSISIEGPSKADIDCKDNEDGTCKVTYKPTEPGNYVVNVKFADKPVPGSPFNVNVEGEGAGTKLEKIVRRTESASVTSVGSECELSLRIPDTVVSDMTAVVTSPSGVSETCQVQPVADNRYTVKFVPKEMGVHTVSVKHRGMHIPGSPFQFTVGPLQEGGAHKVRAGGPGLERGEVSQPCEFSIYTREAGAGGLSIAVEGPGKAEIDFEDRKDGSCGVSYVVQEPGDYNVSVKFNDVHIPDSPFKVNVAPALGEARRLEVASLQDTGLQVNKPAAFKVNFHGAKGHLDARVVSPSGAEDDAFIDRIDDESYAIRFIPRENGVHYVHVKFNGTHIRGSPFRILVGDEHTGDPGKVRVYGDGLIRGVTSRKSEFFVDTTQAGAGTLGISVDGPSKVAIDCHEEPNGYKITYTPQAPGNYYISVKYNGVHVSGSPFKAIVTGQKRAGGDIEEQSTMTVETVTKTTKTQTFAAALPQMHSDASKVTSHGMGLQKAFLHKQNTFHVNASKAGNNMLMVGVYGPKVPCEECCVRHTGRMQYTVNYVVKEKGEYILVVKWGDEHIQGSPFHVTV